MENAGKKWRKGDREPELNYIQNVALCATSKTKQTPHQKHQRQHTFRLNSLWKRERTKKKGKKLARKSIFLCSTQKIKSSISHLINFVRLSNRRMAPASLVLEGDAKKLLNCIIINLWRGVLCGPMLELMPLMTSCSLSSLSSSWSSWLLSSSSLPHCH